MQMSVPKNIREGKLCIYLPNVIISHKRNTEAIVVKINARGVDMAKNTGPFFSITHACK